MPFTPEEERQIELSVEARYRAHKRIKAEAQQEAAEKEVAEKTRLAEEEAAKQEEKKKKGTSILD